MCQGLGLRISGQGGVAGADGRQGRTAGGRSSDGAHLMATRGRSCCSCRANRTRHRGRSSGVIVTRLAVAAIGLTLLVVLATTIGLSMDTDGRRRRNQEIARERRDRQDEETRARDERWLRYIELRRRPTRGPPHPGDARTEGRESQADEDEA